jgi:hypothetical protein
VADQLVVRHVSSSAKTGEVIGATAAPNGAARKIGPFVATDSLAVGLTADPRDFAEIPSRRLETGGKPLPVVSSRFA